LSAVFRRIFWNFRILWKFRIFCRNTDDVSCRTGCETALTLKCAEVRPSVWSKCFNEQNC
jgi:hypothetical protein